MGRVEKEDEFHTEDAPEKKKVLFLCFSHILNTVMFCLLNTL